MYEVDREAEIIKYLPLVERVVQRLSIKTADYESGDLYNIGVIGLMDALRKFDPSKKVPFESYAAIRIKGAIIDEVRKHAKISRYKMAAVNQFYQARQELEQSLKREATDIEICKQLGINQSQLADIYESLHYLASVSLEDTLFAYQEEGMTLKDMVRDPAENVEETLVAEEKRTALVACIKKLGEREQLILSLYYTEELTLKEIAEILEVSIPRVSQIHGKTIAKLRTLIEEELA
ncbi:RNA polymerase sigma factor whiG [Enterococcus sp. C1]|uniref:sigma-70 family RNA polymerase sigma factor n=1 Tax=unclassified Enterococcus TaxID=2608891 RepID=UPI00027213C9|nr:FliA/WhiG family RNA polymerase sigma factor [Enterococcus sp. C1]EJF51372.1 RNA polymerase sigma factor whiG [Enterococcus sp. C1]